MKMNEKRVFIIHGWEGYPEEGWFPWLKKELEKRKFKVLVPSMPETENPKINSWVPFLSKLVKKPDKNTYFVGHSIGCQTILRYLEKVNGKVGGAIFVAGWFSLTKESLPTKKEISIATPWLKKPINLKKVKRKTKNIVAIFSSNDPDVPLKDSKIFKEKLNAEIIVQKKMGHFSGGDRIRKLPIVLKEIIRMSKDK